MTCPASPTTSRYGPDPDNRPDQKESCNIISNLDCGSDGNAPFVIGTDGVLRTLTQDCDVIDAIGLPPRLIKAFLDRTTFDQGMEDMFRGADGTKVPQEQWWKPDPPLLPPPMTAEDKALVEKDNEENKEIIQENIRKMESGELKPCGPLSVCTSTWASGYGDAKLVCKKMLEKASVVRLGQVAGSSVTGYWSPVEHLALLFKSAKTLNILPDLPGELSWFPVNEAAAIFTDLLLCPDPMPPVLHVENPIRQLWANMIATLTKELDIPMRNILPFEEWLDRMRSFAGTKRRIPRNE
ncbi:hypothetical protein Aspvir_002322 [Aspergillus viridinutans]|uniref:Uncharacterized protein n=1 Tax=Aspergillus viridinutans TaxID=75553 RepID=A0A9P3F5P8_ASPVI|nr:uncharacterized protein Aspvir_002322 [Aspergillus viridinutans]GIK06672.1 hypothetical protein Aspvir_002322 [Aspergillus viridinutans]